MALVQKKGGCVYCGQIGFVDVEEDTPDEVVDVEVTLQCQCPDAKVHFGRIKKQTKAQEKVDELFENQSEEVKAFLKAAVVLIGEHKAEKVTVDAGRKIKATISMTSKGNIKVERTATRKEAVEI